MRNVFVKWVVICFLCMMHGCLCCQRSFMGLTVFEVIESFALQNLLLSENEVRIILSTTSSALGMFGFKTEEEYNEVLSRVRMFLEKHSVKDIIVIFISDNKHMSYWMLSLDDKKTVISQFADCVEVKERGTDKILGW